MISLLIVLISYVIYISYLKMKMNLYLLNSLIPFIIVILILYTIIPNPLKDYLYDATSQSKDFLGKQAVDLAYSSRDAITANLLSNISVKTFFTGYDWESLFGGYQQLGHSHNLFIEIIVVAGWPMFLMSLIMIAKITSHLTKALFRKSNTISYSEPILFGFIIFVAVFLTNNWNEKSAPLFGYWWALTVYYIEEKRLNNKT